MLCQTTERRVMWFCSLINPWRLQSRLAWKHDTIQMDQFRCEFKQGWRYWCQHIVICATRKSHYGKCIQHNHHTKHASEGNFETVQRAPTIPYYYRCFCACWVEKSLNRLISTLSRLTAVSGFCCSAEDWPGVRWLHCVRVNYTRYSYQQCCNTRLDSIEWTDSIWSRVAGWSSVSGILEMTL